MFRGVAEAAAEAGANLLLLAAPPDRPADVAPIRDAAADRFVTIFVPDFAPRIEALRERGLPTVVMDRPRRTGVAWVGIDDRGACRQDAAHLIALGHRRFALVIDRLGQKVRSGLARREDAAEAFFKVNHERLAGYAAAIEEAGMHWHDVRIYETPANTIDAGRAAALLDRSPRPPAILATTDQLAFGVLAAARTRGIGVPEDLSVIGFDDLPAAAAASPPLTTIRQSLVEKGRVAGRLALAAWPKDRPPEVILPVELVVRASTGPAPT